MKTRKIAMLIATCIASLTAHAELPAIDSYTFAKGDKVANLNIGLGSLNGSFAFGQQLSMEWCVVDGLIGNRASLGVGFAINNNALGKYTTYMSGHYDYTYTTTTYSSRYNKTYTGTQRREGYGRCNAVVTQDNISAMATCSFHFQFTNKLECYALVGFGVGANFNIFDYYNVRGLEEKNHDNTFQNGSYETRVVYSYNDFDHVVWESGIKKASACFAVSSLVGARYYFSPQWGAQMELGMIGGTFNRQTTSGCTVWSIGISHKF